MRFGEKGHAENGAFAGGGIDPFGHQGHLAIVVDETQTAQAFMGDP